MPKNVNKQLKSKLTEEKRQRIIDESIKNISVSPENSELYECKVCDKLFFSKSSISSHLTIHVGRRKKSKLYPGEQEKLVKSRMGYAQVKFSEMKGWPMQGGSPGLGKKK